MLGTNIWWKLNDLNLTIKLYKWFRSKSFIQFVYWILQQRQNKEIIPWNYNELCL